MTTSHVRIVAMSDCLHLGVGVLLRRAGTVLLGLRAGSQGDGTWGLPGGHVEGAEDPLCAAARELREETGLVATRLRSAGWTLHDDAAARRRYVTLLAEAEADGEPQRCEPQKCLQWRWFDTGALPPNLFEPTRLALATISAAPASADDPRVR
jgi:8-oxo-dGTP diphosphatase